MSEPVTDTRARILVGPDLARIVDAASIEIAQCPSIFQRDGELVSVLRALEADGQCGVVAGTPQIRPISTTRLREELSRVVDFAKATKKSEVSVAPPTDVAEALRQRGTWPGVQPLSGVVDSPCMRADGTIADSAGYDAATGLIIGQCAGVAVIDSPSRDDAEAALQRLVMLLGDFPFASGAGPYVAIAAIMAMLARPAIRGACPMFVFDASTPGSGKSLLADIVSTITTGRSAPRMTYPPDDAELEKVLSSAALFGARLLCVDNIAHALGGPALDKVLTADDRVAMRVLGRSEWREVQWRSVIMATGNNVTLGGDTARRTLIARLEPKVERPEERSGFRHSDILAHARQQRGDYVRDALTVLRAFVVAGQPDAATFVWGSFQGFAGLVAGAIGWAGGANILSASAVALGVVPPEKEALRVVVDRLPGVVGGGATARTIIDTIWYPIERGERRVDGLDDLRDALGELCRIRRSDEIPTTKTLGIALRRWIGVVVGGRSIRSRLSRTNSQEWTVDGADQSAGTAGTCRDFHNPSRAIKKENQSGSGMPASQHVPALPAVERAS